MPLIEQSHFQEWIFSNLIAIRRTQYQSRKYNTQFYPCMKEKRLPVKYEFMQI
jgi:hypothetical protein